MVARPITINMRPEDSANLKFIMGELGVGPSETLRLCVEECYRKKTDFSDAIVKSKKFDNSEINVDTNDLKPKSFLVEEDVFREVYDEVKQQLGLLKPRISYVIRLCLVATRVARIKSEDSSQEEKNIEDIDGKALPSKGDAMMMLGRLYEAGSDTAREKIGRITKIMEEKNE